MAAPQDPVAMETSNTTNCPSELPAAYAYIADLPLAYKIVFFILGALVVTMLIMYVETVVFYFKRLYNWKPKDKAKWVLAVYPIFGITSFISLIVPRSSNVNDLVATSYLAVCTYQFVTMLIGHYGGAKLMASKLSGCTINLSTPPCCCCCRCLPHPDVTRKNIHTVQSLVIQYAVIGPVLSYSMAIIWADDDIYANPFTNPSTYMSLVNTVASLVALWGMSVTFHFSAGMLQHTHVKPKFFCMQLISVFHNLQGFLINILILSGVFPCEHQLNDVAVGLRYHHMLMIVEMFVLWCIARHYYRDIGAIPLEEQVYVETCNMATNVTGTLLKDLDASSSRSSVYGPTCARDLIREEQIHKALTLMGNKTPVSFSQDGSNSHDILLQRRLQLATEISDYEPVMYRKGRRSEIGGPPAKHAKMGGDANAKSRINRSNMMQKGGEPSPSKKLIFSRKRTREQHTVSTGTGPDEGPAPLQLGPSPAIRNSDPSQGQRQRLSLGPVYEEPPAVGDSQPGDSWVAPLDRHKSYPPASMNRQNSQQGEPVPQQYQQKPQQQQRPEQRPPSPPIYNPNQYKIEHQAPRSPSVASSTGSSKASTRPFIMLQPASEDLAEDGGSRPGSAVPPGRAARRAKRAAKDSGFSAATTSPGEHKSAFHTVAPPEQSGAYPQQRPARATQQQPARASHLQPAVSVDQVGVRVDSTV